MIDPQGQANKWIKKTYGETLKVVKLNQATFARTIENAIPFGTPVLIENVGEVLDPVLEPVLLKQVVVRGGAKTLKFGDGEIEYDLGRRSLRGAHARLCRAVAKRLG